MNVIVRLEAATTGVLVAELSTLDPWVRNDVLERSAFRRVQFQHPGDYVAGLAREETEDAPRALDDLGWLRRV
jgi:hypothetical protein